MDRSLLPQVIFVLGVDGCGKTTLAGWLSEHLNGQGIRSRVVWSRFNNYLSKPLLALTRLTGHNHYRLVGGQPFGFHDFEGLHGYNRLFAALQAIDVNIGAWRHILRKRRGMDVLVGERGPWDTLVDVMADTGLDGLAGTPTGRLYTRLIRGRSKAVYVSRTLDNILKTRPELAEDYKMARKIGLYQALAAREGWPVIDNNGTLDEARRALLAVVGSGFAPEGAERVR